MNNQTTTIHRDGDAIVIDIPMNLRRRSGRKEIILPPNLATVHGSSGYDTTNAKDGVTEAHGVHDNNDPNSHHAASTYYQKTMSVARCGGIDSGFYQNNSPAEIGSAAAYTKPSPLALAIARAFRWQEMIETGRAKSNCALARKLKLDQSYIARTIRLTSLAPDLIEAILIDHEPETLNINALRQNLPLCWHEQRRVHMTQPTALTMPQLPSTG